MADERQFRSLFDCDSEMSKGQSPVVGRFGRITIAQNSGRVTTARNALHTDAAPDSKRPLHLGI